MPSKYETISVRQDGSIGTVEVSRPDAMNAVNTEVLREMAEAIKEVSTDSRVIILTGKGDEAFIGGGDIKDFQERSGLWFHSEFRDAMLDLGDAIEGSRIPIIAAINGVALGGGTEIALMCDLIIAKESAKFGLPESGLGIIPGGGGTQRLSHAVGYLKAKELVLTGKHIPAAEAADINLANEVIPDDQFDDRIEELANELAEGAPIAQWFAKTAINQTRGKLETGLELEAALTSLLFETDDAKEGFNAFVEQRDPNFGNRRE